MADKEARERTIREARGKLGDHPLNRPAPTQQREEPEYLPSIWRCQGCGQSYVADVNGKPCAECNEYDTYREYVPASRAEAAEARAEELAATIEAAYREEEWGDDFEAVVQEAVAEFRVTANCEEQLVHFVPVLPANSKQGEEMVERAAEGLRNHGWGVDGPADDEDMEHARAALIAAGVLREDGSALSGGES